MQKAVKNKYYIRKGIYNHNVTITQSETAKATFGSIWPLHIILRMYNTFKLEMLTVTFIYIQQSRSDIFYHVLSPFPPNQIQAAVNVSFYLWFANLISLWFSSCLSFSDVLDYLNF